jgi:hypothetical protein
MHWINESYAMAVKYVYLNGKLKTSADKTEGPVLPNGYLVTAKATAERRMVLAGYRLALTL